MNKIYKVIYCKATQTWVAVSEITKSHGKGGIRGTRRRVGNPFDGRLKALTMAVLMGLGAMSNQAMASEVCVTNDGTTNAATGTATGASSLACGSGATAKGNSTVVGSGAQAKQAKATVVGKSAEAWKQSVAVGAEAKAGESKNTRQTVSIGYQSFAKGDQSIALGANTLAEGNSSISIGGDDLDLVASPTKPANTVMSITDAENANSNPAAIIYKNITGDILVHYENHGGTTNTPGKPNRYQSTKSGAGSVAVGVQSTAADLATSFGTRANATGTASLALGVGSNASKEGAIAIGAGSTTATDATQVSGANTVIGGKTYHLEFKGDEAIVAGDQVSVGQVGYERQIKNVAPGAITKTSTDAINGSQLYSIATELDRDTYFHTNASATKATTIGADNKGKLNETAGAQGGYSLAAGVNAQAVGLQSIAIGYKANTNVSSTDSIAIGREAKTTNHSAVAVGERTEAYVHAVAVGDNAKALSSSGSAVGVDTKALSTHSTAIGSKARAGNYKYDSSGNIVLDINGKKVIDPTTFQATAIGYRSRAEGQLSVAVGGAAYAKNQGDAAFGNGADATGGYSTAIGQDTTASAEHTTALGTSAFANQKKATALGYLAKAQAESSVAIGDSSKVTSSTAKRAIAIGNTAQVSVADGVALGSISVANRAALTTPTATDNVTDVTAQVYALPAVNTTDKAAIVATATNTLGAVSVGSATQNRQITNVAAGAADSDAVNVAQLKAVATAANRENYFHVNDGTTVQVAGDATTNKGTVDAKGGATGEHALAAGVSAQAVSKGAVAVGYKAKAEGSNSIAVGSAPNAPTAMGDSTTTNVASGVALGASAHAHNGTALAGAYGSVYSMDEPAFNTLIGNTRKGFGATALGAGAQAYNGTTGSVNSGSTAIGFFSQAKGGAAVGVGTQAKAMADKAVAIGYYAEATVADGVALGSISVANRGALTSPTTSGSQITNIGTGGVSKTVFAINSADDSAKTAIINTVKGTLGAVSVGNTDNTRQIINVAAGSEDTDAVNVAQLRAVSSHITTTNTIIGNASTTQQGLVTYDVSGQNATKNNDLLTTVKNMNEGGIKFFHTNDGTGDQPTNGSYNTDTKDAQAIGKYSTGIGYSASANTESSIAIGNAAVAGDKNDTAKKDAIAIGTGAKATGNQSISIGTGNVVSGNNSGAIGDPTYINADNSYAIGNANTIAASAGQTFILGNNVSATAANNVILGNNSSESSATTTAGAFNQVSSATVSGTTYSGFAGTASGIVSVGKTGAERQIINVAPGAITAASTDAINGSQLFSVAKKLDRDTYFHTNSTMTVVAYDPLEDNKGKVDETAGAFGAYSLAAGFQTHAVGQNSVAVGFQNKIRQTALHLSDDTTALGQRNEADNTKNGVLLGANNTIAASNSVATIGGSNAAVGSHASSLTGIGNRLNNGSAVNIVGIANTVSQTSGLTGPQLLAFAALQAKLQNNPTATLTPAEIALIDELSSNMVSGTANKLIDSKRNSVLGNLNTLTKGTENFVAGFNNKLGTGLNNVQVIGSDVTVSDNNQYSVAIGSKTKVEADNSVALGSNSEANRAALASPTTSGSQITSIGTGGGGKMVFAISSADSSAKTAITNTVKGTLGAVSVGNTDNTRQIINVAAGSEDTDAVNVAQLRAVASVATTATTASSVPLTITGNTNADTDAETIAGKTYAVGDGTQQQLGETLNIIGSTAAVAGVAADATGNATAGAYSAKNVQTVVTNGQVQIQLAENPEFTSVKTGNTTINNNGLTIAGGPSVTSTGINAGGSKITNVAAGTISANSTDAVNGSQLHQIVGYTAGSGGFALKAQDGNAVTQALGQSIEVVGGGTTTGTYSSANVKTIVNNGKVEIQLAESPKFGDVTINDGGTGKITGVTAGDINATSKDAVNGSQIHNIASQNATNVFGGNATVNTDGSTSFTDVGGTGKNTIHDAIQSINNTANAGFTVAGASATTAADAQIAPADTLNIVGAAANTNFAQSDAGKNIYTIADANNTVRIGLANNLDVKSVKAQTVNATTSVTIGDASDPTKSTTLTSGANGLDVGGDKITNVAPGAVGANSTDAINGSQLYNSMANVNRNINSLYQALGDIKDTANAGTASALAAANLPQPHDPGASMVSAALGHYRGESALSVGVSTISDNGKWIIKGSLTHDTQSNTGVGVGVGYQW